MKIIAMVQHKQNDTHSTKSMSNATINKASKRTNRFVEKSDKKHKQQQTTQITNTK